MEGTGQGERDDSAGVCVCVRCVRCGSVCTTSRHFTFNIYVLILEVNQI